MTEPTKNEIELFDATTALARRLAAQSAKVAGVFTDTKMMSNMLYHRLWGHHRAYRLLWDKRLYIEADMVLRAALEATISIAANHKMGHDFIELINQDVAATVKGQIKVARERGGIEAIKSGEAILRRHKARSGTQKEPKKLNFEDLAQMTELSPLYVLHRQLSGLSSHVTGLSLIRGLQSPSLQETQDRMNAAQRQGHFTMMANASLKAIQLHAEMVGEQDISHEAVELVYRSISIALGLPIA